MNYAKIFCILATLFIFSCNADESDSRTGFDANLASNEVGGVTPNQVGGVYNEIEENPFIEVSDESTSTFSVDADGASYANVRRYLQQGRQLPPKDAVRTEELLNYFDLDYEFNPQHDYPISLYGEIAGCPWNIDNKLISINIEGKSIPLGERPSSNFVFLIDVSGSMSGEDRLPILKDGFKLFVEQMDDNDRVAIVTYAGSAGIVLPSTSGAKKQEIIDAIESLGSGGSTAGAEGINTAYSIAEANFIPNGNNRIIIGTDGDFNVGISNQEDLIDLIKDKRESGVYITVLGVGRGNYRDGALEQIANNGNGTFEYIDNVKQLEKVFINDYDKFYSVAKDVKIQVEFEPTTIKAYRLIGYENRVLENADFEDDKKDAGEIGAGQNITALYEVIPLNLGAQPRQAFTIKYRFKRPNEDNSIEGGVIISDNNTAFEDASDPFKFCASLSAFAMLLRDSEYKGTSNYSDVLEWTNNSQLEDKHGYKEEYKSLVEIAKSL